jgi:uncharacterized protein with von Willebrand factor type A (vWA) domain
MTDVPDFAGARQHVIHEVVRFTRRLRADGVHVPANAALPAVEALVAVGFDDRDRVETALFASLVRDPADREAFDAAFETFWVRFRSGLEASVDAADDEDASTGDDGDASDGPAPLLADDDSAEVDDAADGIDDPDGEVALESRQVTDSDGTPPAVDGDGDRAGTYTSAGRRETVATETTDTDRVDPAALRRFEGALATLSGRRWSRATAGEAVDARRALRESLDTGGLTMTLPRREREEAAFRTTLLVDVSRSVLDAIDRGYLLSFVADLLADGRSVRAFFFDTDIRDVTDAFGDGRTDPADALAAAEVDWGGGTQIGASLASLRRRWPHAIDRRTAAIIVSDGLDVGDVDDLEREMAWLARRAGAVVWLNPLAAASNYEPTCRGMAASLPYVDGLFAFAGNDDLREIARQLARHGHRGPVGYEQDFRDRTGEVES